VISASRQNKGRDSASLITGCPSGIRVEIASSRVHRGGDLAKVLLARLIDWSNPNLPDSPDFTSKRICEGGFSCVKTTGNRNILL
jgi:hypothetical protein